jgi:predicted kinase
VRHHNPCRVRNHVNPDHYLQTPDGRVSSAERGKQAWESAYAELESLLQEFGASGTLYVVCGLQGAGKTTWIAKNAARLGSRAVFFDAALPSRQHRRRALDLAARYSTPAVAVWINVPIEVALRRNLKRPLDEQVPEATIRHVLGLLEPPSVAEGFADVVEVKEP